MGTPNRVGLHTIPRLSIKEADAAALPLPDIATNKAKVLRDLDGTVCAYTHTVNGIHWMHLPELASFRFGGGEDDVVAIASHPIRKERILDAYYRSVLPRVLHTRGQEALHASAVLTRDGVVALCATSGTGKSTTAFGLSQRGWPLWADDAVAFEALDSSIRALPVPFGLRLLPDATAFFDQDLTPASGDPNQNSADRIKREPVPLAALLLLNRVRGGNDWPTVQVRRLSAGKAFTEVLVHAYCFNVEDAEQKQSMVRNYLDLIARVPVFEIHFQPGLKKFPAVLDAMSQLIRQVSGEAT